MSKLLLRRVSLVVGVLVMVAGAVTTGCDDDDTKAASPDGATPPIEAGGDARSAVTGEVSGQATYAGAKSGPLIIGLFKEAPAPGKVQTPVAVGSNESPTWPGTNAFTIKGAPEGTFFVGGYIMVGPEHRMQGAQRSDPITAPPVQVTVKAGSSATANVTIIDRPTVGDGGADADAADAGDSG